MTFGAARSNASSYQSMILFEATSAPRIPPLERHDEDGQCIMAMDTLHCEPSCGLVPNPPWQPHPLRSGRPAWCNHAHKASHRPPHVHTGPVSHLHAKRTLLTEHCSLAELTSHAPCKHRLDRRRRIQGSAIWNVQFVACMINQLTIV